MSAITLFSPVMDLLNHLTLRTLTLLSAISTCGSLTKASAQLHIVPSAASRRIRTLEEALGFALLERTSRGVELNPAGQAIARYAEQVSRDISELSDELSDLATGMRGRVRLSAAASAIAQHLPEDLSAFLHVHPDIRVDLQEHFSSIIIQKLRDNETDIGILVAGSAPIAGLTLQEYRREQLVVVLPCSHPLVGSISVAFADLLDENWVGLPSGTSLARMLDAQARLYGVKLRRPIEVYGMDSACRMVQNGLGIALLPSKALEPADKFPGITTIPLAEEWAVRTLYVAVLTDATLEPSTKALITSLTAPVNIR